MTGHGTYLTARICAKVPPSTARLLPDLPLLPIQCSLICLSAQNCPIDLIGQPPESDACRTPAPQL
jgi:hypothetical protein